MGWDWVGWDLCAGLFYEHRFAMLITAFRSFSGPTNSTSLVAAWCLVFGADILSSPEKITYQNSQEIPSKMEQHCNAVKSCFLLEKYPFFHNSMCSLQCLLFKISQSTAAAGSSVLLCLKSSFSKPDIARYMARHQYLEVRRLSCYPAICLHIKTNVGF